ncbi:MAG: ABC-2 family transporter protein [Candidatus Hydrogenedentes bacterium]|nr:ABC-2 family transporter protein [Candidatus Hydrogenedentota bacterium]
MYDSISLYIRYLAISVRGQMQYRASFLLTTFGNVMITGIEFFGLWALFARFGNLRGWTLPEVALFYGMIHVPFALAECFARGFDVFPALIKRGDFDRILLRPRTTFLQILGAEVRLNQIGRMLQGLVVLIWAATVLDVTWTLPRIALLCATTVCGTCLFCGLRVLEATMAFWSTDSLEIMNCLTYGGVETAQHPLAIYRPWFRRFFTFIVPLACVNYFPAHAILGRADILGSPAIIQWISPIVGIIFMLVTIQVWRFGVRHYTSTGS